MLASRVHGLISQFSMWQRITTLRANFSLIAITSRGSYVHLRIPLSVIALLATTVFGILTMKTEWFLEEGK